MIPERAKQFYAKYQRWVPAAFFVFGFLFDIVMLSRIDDVAALAQQAVYLAIVAMLISIALIETRREVVPPAWLGRVWRYREAALDFLLGALLSNYALLFFKSASALASLAFVVVLFLVLISIELKRFGRFQTQVHVALFGLCLMSYMVCLSPVAIGFIGTFPFLVALFVSGLLIYLLFRKLERRIGEDPRPLRRQLIYPYAAVKGLFVVLYLANVLPPVPLSIKDMGIYHAVERKPEGWELVYTRPFWKFWQKGDQTFSARPGDAIHCYVQVFSPARFQENLQVRWLYREANGRWQHADAIPLPVTGGREQGYRAFTRKNNYQPGRWRCQVETGDGQEIGRIGFEVVTDETTDERPLHRTIR